MDKYHNSPYAVIPSQIIIPGNKHKQNQKQLLKSYKEQPTSNLIETLAAPVLNTKWLGVTPRLIVELDNNRRSIETNSDVSDKDGDDEDDVRTSQDADIANKPVSKCQLVIAQGSVVEFGSHGLNINMAIVNAANEGCQGGGGKYAIVIFIYLLN